MSTRGKGKSTIALIDAAHTILEEIQPASVRAVAYKLFTMQIIKDMSKASTDTVSRHLVWARENGIIPWSWVVDESREPERIASWDNPDEIIRAAVRGYRKDYWTTQPNRVEVWSEKGTLRGTLAPVLESYGVTFRVLHGYGSATSIHSAAEESAESDKPLTVLYCGDHDPSGRHISEVDLPNRLIRYGGTVTIKRVALDDTDTEPGTKLPWFQAKTKSKDPRFSWFVEHYGTRCFEVDALSPVVLRERIEDEILALLDTARWDHAVCIEDAERESMQTFLAGWQSNLRQAAKY